MPLKQRLYHFLLLKNIFFFCLFVVLMMTPKAESLANMTTEDKNDDDHPGENDDFLRQIFIDRNNVKIYPDDFIINEEEGSTTTTLTDIIFPDLIDRYQGHFSNRRLVVLFKPGIYHNINFPVGYWTQVLGLGITPDQVKFTGNLGVYCLPANTDNPDVGSLDTFWRSGENFVSETKFIEGKAYGENGNEVITWNVPIIDNDLDGKDVNDRIIKSLKTPDDGKSYPKLSPLPTIVEGSDNYEPSHGMLWAVSQAAPLRRVNIQNGNLHLSLGGGYASGGYIGNVNIQESLMLGTQQQFCIRNTNIGLGGSGSEDGSKGGKAIGGAWSMVYIGCEKAKEGTKNEEQPKQPKQQQQQQMPRVVWEPKTETRIEKPYIFVESNKAYLGVPKLQKDSSGVDYSSTKDKMERYEISTSSSATARVFTPNDNFEYIQTAANNGIKIILSPGIYNWKQTLEIKQDNMVLLGLGMAAIKAPGTGKPCIKVNSNAQGVRISGISLEASVISKFIYKGSTLLEWGDKDHIAKGGSSTNPGAIHDLYCFVGGRSERTVKVETMVKIYSNHVVGDNLWLWRADHVQLLVNELPNKPELSEYHVTTYGECQCDIGLQVYGNYITMYGLAVEHTYKNMVEWYGTHGKVYFYQSELPYDVPGYVYNDKDITGYRVYVGANDHIAKGIGVYSYFRDYDDIVVETAVATHGLRGVFENVFTVWLNGYSGIKSIINRQGPLNTEPGGPVFLDTYKGESYLSPTYWMGVLKKIFSFWLG